MTPPANLLARLAAARRDGVTFDEAWPPALDGALAAVERADRAQWEHAFTATREAWEAAFDRQPATRGARALAVIAGDPGREPLAA